MTDNHTVLVTFTVCIALAFGFIIDVMRYNRRNREDK